MFAILLMLFILATSVGEAITNVHVPNGTPSNRGILGSAEEFGRIHACPIVDAGFLSTPESLAGLPLPSMVAWLLQVRSDFDPDYND